MIVIRIEMWPGGDDKRAYLLGLATLTNDGKGTQTTGHYQAELFGDQVDPMAEVTNDAPFLPKVTGSPQERHRFVLDLLKSPRAKAKGVWRRGRVEAFPRQRQGVWDLLYRALRDAVGDRSPR